MSNKNQKKQEEEPSYINDDPISCKVILVGDSNVGKTTIINRYLNKYNPYEKNTVGASFSTRKEIINNYQLILDIWDTAGQERFHAVNQIFYKEAYICLLIYDITSQDSFESLKNYWHKTVKENAIDGIIFVVCGNKIDLFEDEKVNQNEVKEYCKSIDAEHKLISAKANNGIDELFISVGKKFLESNFFKNIKADLKQRQEEKIRKVASKENKKGCC